MNRIYLSITIVILLSGCAIHAPMSEMLMFQAKSSDGQKYNAVYAHALGTYTVDIIDKDRVNNYVSNKQNYPRASGEHPDYEYEQSIVTQGILLGDTAGNVAASIAVGSIFGIDVTVRPFQDYFVTGSAAVVAEKRQELQFIVQKRLYYNSEGGQGLAAGIIFNKNDIYVPLEGGDYYCTLCLPNTSLTTYSAGFRGVLILAGSSNYGEPRGFLYANGSLNYDFVLHTIFPQISLSLGIY